MSMDSGILLLWLFANKSGLVLHNVTIANANTINLSLKINLFTKDTYFIASFMELLIQQVKWALYLFLLILKSLDKGIIVPVYGIQFVLNTTVTCPWVWVVWVRCPTSLKRILCVEKISRLSLKEFIDDYIRDLQLSYFRCSFWLPLLSSVLCRSRQEVPQVHDTDG